MPPLSQPALQPPSFYQLGIKSNAATRVLTALSFRFALTCVPPRTPKCADISRDSAWPPRLSTTRKLPASAVSSTTCYTPKAARPTRTSAQSRDPPRRRARSTPAPLPTASNGSVPTPPSSSKTPLAIPTLPSHQSQDSPRRPTTLAPSTKKS